MYRLVEQKRRKQNGFTVIEMLAVVIIISMLAAFVVPRVFKGMGDAKAKIAKSKMATIDGAIAQFKMHCDRYPLEEEGLLCLVEMPGDLEGKWQGAYLKRSDLLDPWDNPYVFIAEGVANIGSYDIKSYGADGVEGGEGDNLDIVND